MAIDMSELLNLMTWELLAIAVMMVAIIILMFKLRKNTNIIAALDYLIKMTENQNDITNDFYGASILRLDRIAGTAKLPQQRPAEAVQRPVVPVQQQQPQQPVYQQAVPEPVQQPAYQPAIHALPEQVQHDAKLYRAAAYQKPQEPAPQEQPKKSRWS
jgi:FtsZ-interacting cell division protein ZipA